MQPIHILEYHLAHGCNLSCHQCSHYSNFKPQGVLPRTDDTEKEYQAWSNRLRPYTFALLGGEPTLNPYLTDHVYLARQYWPNSNLLLVSNGFFLKRHPELPSALMKNRCFLEISQHGITENYLKEFESCLEILKQWISDYPFLPVKIRMSHESWMRQYKMENGKPFPFSSDPKESYSICMQKNCTQLYSKKLWKCPAIAYFKLMEKKMNISNLKEWQLFRDYSACDPGCTEDELKKFLEKKEIPQCSLCPAEKEKFVHPDPTFD